MLVHIPNVLTPEQVAHCRARIDQAQWVDGNVTSGHQSAQAKVNEQLPEECAEAREMGDMIVDALSRNQLFMSAAQPQRVFPPLFNRYGPGMTFGNHVDAAMRTHAQTGQRIRTDLSATLFLTNPEDYDGGELLIDATFGVQSVKLPAGDMVLYPATSLHRVAPITRGARVSSFFWMQSMIREDAQRSLLFDLDMSIIRLTSEKANQAALVSLTGVYHNLLRMWGEP
jgi:PKHD-type hydroxylase